MLLREHNIFSSEPPKLHFVCLPWVKACDITPNNKQKQCKRPVGPSGNSGIKDVRQVSEAAAFPRDRPQRSPSGPGWAAEEEQTRVLLVLHTALAALFL